MTQYTDRIKKQEQKLTEEKLDQQVTSIDVRFGRIQTRYRFRQSSYRIPQR
jgi:hypothetical protein